MAQELRQIVRIINVDIPGQKQLALALAKVKGIGPRFANGICNIAKLEKTRKLGSLNQQEVEQIEDIIKNPMKYSMPTFLFNRRKDFESGSDVHITTSDLKLTTDFDVKRLRRIKCYRGIRHALGLPVRGQRTKSHFRKKGKAVGVKRTTPKKGKKG